MVLGGGGEGVHGGGVHLYLLFDLYIILVCLVVACLCLITVPNDLKIGSILLVVCFSMRITQASCLSDLFR